MTDNIRFGFPLEYVPDLEAAKRFYVDVLGLEVTRTSPEFIQFKDKNGAAYAIAGDEPMDKGAKLELYWLVDDAESAFKEISVTAEVSLPLKQMPFGKVFGIKDPAGQSRYLIEFAKARPSQAVS